ncbi:MAG: hypothetical protein RLZZ50_1326, partial [Verrucomicrobiota bacterium]
MKPAAPVSAPAGGLDAAIAHHQAGRLEPALAIYRALRARLPRDPRLLHLGGLALLQLERAEESVSWLETAVAVAPRSGSTWMCLGVALGRLGRAEAAEKALRRAVEVEPSNGEAWTNLGLALGRSGKGVDALAALRRGAEARPRDPSGWLSLGQYLLSTGRPAEALVALGRAGAQPGAAAARAACHHALGDMEAAYAAFSEELSRNPADAVSASQRLLVMHYFDRLTVEELTRAHCEYGAALRARLGPPAMLAPRPASSGPLRLGFFSPDLRDHAVARFLEPLLPAVAEAGCEIFLYHNHPNEDAVSARLCARAALWRNLAGLSDEAAARQIRADAPDVMVDLAGHTGHARPGIFARRVAPVQINYLGYPNGTGLDTMDYRFTDAIADPPGAADTHAVEKLVRFSSCAWCYLAPENLPEPVPPPASLDAGRPVVFGSFNHLGKLSPDTWALWSRVLDAVPGSVLLLKGTPPGSEWLGQRTSSAGIDPARVKLLPFAPSRSDHFAAYGQVDIALDPVPYHGTTTTCEALWMGRPVIALAGDRHVRRVGASLLTAVGAGDLVAGTPENYVEIAVRLASDRAALARRCAGLRGALKISP